MSVDCFPGLPACLYGPRGRPAWDRAARRRSAPLPSFSFLSPLQHTHLKAVVFGKCENVCNSPENFECGSNQLIWMVVVGGLPLLCPSFDNPPPNCFGETILSIPWSWGSAGVQMWSRAEHDTSAPNPPKLHEAFRISNHSEFGPWCCRAGHRCSLTLLDLNCREHR